MSGPLFLNRRRHPRFTVVVRIDVQIRVLGALQPYLFRTVNLSQMGMLVASVGDDPKLEGEPIWEVCLFLPRRDGGADKVQATVNLVYKSADLAYGLKITGIDSANKHALGEFLKRVAKEGADLGP